MSDSSKAAPRLLFLDCVRGLAASAVVLEHVGYCVFPHFRVLTHAAFSFGKFGLASFFLVSGFVIPMSIEKTNNLGLFWLHRVFRLYPIYWLSLGVILLLHQLGCPTELTPAFAAHMVRNGVVGLTMLQEFVHVPHAIGLYYTLTIEMAFYVACSALAVLGWFRRSELIAWLLLGGGTAIWLGAPLLLHRRVEMAGLFYVVTLFVGTAIYRTFTGEIHKGRLQMLLLAAAASTMAGIWLNYVRYPKNDPLEHYSFLAVCLPWLAGYGLFLAALTLRARQYPAAFVWLGGISYSMYLLHPIVLGLVYPGERLPVGAPDLLRFSLTLICVGLLSWATYTWIERPMIRAGRKLAHLLAGNSLLGSASEARSTTQTHAGAEQVAPSTPAAAA